MSSIEKKDKSDNVLIFEILSSFGIRGAIKLRSYLLPSTEVKKISSFFDETGLNYRLSFFNIKGDVVHANVEGVNNRDESDKLKNKKLYTKRVNLPEIVNGEYYSFDLIGLQVKNQDLKVIGEIKAIKNFGASDLLEIRNDNKLFYHPFAKKFIDEVNLKKGYVIINIHEEIEVRENI